MSTKVFKLLCVVFAFVFFCVDQLSKQAAAHFMSYGETITLFYGFNLRLAYNQGVAFSFLAENKAAQAGGLACLAIALILFLLIWFFRIKPQERSTMLALAAIISGALGNLADRLYFGYVIDFIDLYIGQWHWPVFNVADSLICIGAFFIAIKTVKTGEK
jgi:signal peptidase II